MSGGFFRGVWLLPRMSPSVLYILLWLWAVSPSEVGLLNQVLMQGFGLDAPLDLLTQAPIALIIIANGFIGASLGMIIFTAAIRGIPEHLFHAAEVDGAGTLAQIRFITLPALRWPISFVTIYQTLSLLVSFEYILLLTKGGPFYDTTVYRPLRLPARLRERPVRLRRRAGALPHRHRRGRRAARLALLRHGAPAAAPAHRGALRWRRRRRSPNPGSGRAGRGLGRAGRARPRACAGPRRSALYAFLIAVSLPIILPYFWLVTIAFSARTGVAETRGALALDAGRGAGGDRASGWR